MTVPVMNVNGVRISMSLSARGARSSKGLTCFKIELTVPEEINKALISIPTPRRMQELAWKYLKSEYREPFRRQGLDLQFLLKQGLRQEDRAAFFGAVCANIHVPLPRF